jgi:ferredoxin--NADP+ reductase
VSRPLHVAIVGSGPSGFYAVQALFRSGEDVRCDMLDRLPTPFGLVRGGVAPDHQKIKRVVKAYEKLAADDRFRFFGNVELGKDVQIAGLLEHYDQVVLAVGAQSARTLGIPGERLDNSLSATAFVAWYNGHPDFQDVRIDTDVDDVVVVGVGNVAMDVTRVLACTPEHLATTDITHRAAEQLGRHNRARIHVLGRRGPAQAAFTPKEVQEMAGLDGIDVRVRPDEAALDPLSAAWLQEHGERNNRDNVAFVQERVGERDATDRCEVWLRFCASPVEILGSTHVEGVRVEKTRIVERDGRLRPERTGETEVIDAGLVLTAVGYRSVPLPGVPFDDASGRIPNDEGQVLDDGKPVADLYVVGWAKRGPTGLIGTNRADSTATVKRMLADGVKRPGTSDDPGAWLAATAPRHVSWAGWEQLDSHEVVRGEPKGKIREKIVSIDEMLGHLED